MTPENRRRGFSTAMAALALGGALSHWTLYVHLACMLMQGEALRMNATARRLWQDVDRLSR